MIRNTSFGSVKPNPFAQCRQTVRQGCWQQETGQAKKPCLLTQTSSQTTLQQPLYIKKQHSYACMCKHNRALRDCLLNGHTLYACMGKANEMQRELGLLYDQ